MLLSGRKEFLLFSPADTHRLYLSGEPTLVHRNGLINYADHATRIDGADESLVRRYELNVARDELTAAEQALEQSPNDAQLKQVSFVPLFVCVLASVLSIFLHCIDRWKNLQRLELALEKFERLHSENVALADVDDGIDDDDIDNDDEDGGGQLCFVVFTIVMLLWLLGLFGAIDEEGEQLNDGEHDDDDASFSVDLNRDDYDDNCADHADDDAYVSSNLANDNDDGDDNLFDAVVGDDDAVNARGRTRERKRPKSSNNASTTDDNGRNSGGDGGGSNVSSTSTRKRSNATNDDNNDNNDDDEVRAERSSNSAKQQSSSSSTATTTSKSASKSTPPNTLPQSFSRVNAATSFETVPTIGTT